MIIIKVQGGIGNQIFQYALGRAFERKGKVVKYDINSYKDYRHPFRLKYFNVRMDIASDDEIEKTKNFKYLDLKIISSYKLINKLFQLFDKLIYVHCAHIIEKPFFFEKRIFNLDNRYLEGYWADSKYYYQVKNFLKHELSIQPKYKNKNLENLATKIKESNLPYVSIHIRRGDYLWNVNKNIFSSLPKEYYIKSLMYIKKKIGKVKVLVFSNDINWCKENFSKEFEYIDREYNFEDYYEFELMKLCQHNVIANSTFSFWAAFLNENPNKIVIAPKIWYTNKKWQEKYKKGTFLPTDWIKI